MKYLRMRYDFTVLLSPSKGEGSAHPVGFITSMNEVLEAVKTLPRGYGRMSQHDLRLNTGYVYNGMKQKIQGEIAACIANAGLDGIYITAPVSLAVRVALPSRQRDTDGAGFFIKFLGDALQAAGTLVNDRQVVHGETLPPVYGKTPEASAWITMRTGMDALAPEMFASQDAYSQEVDHWSKVLAKNEKAICAIKLALQGIGVQFQDMSNWHGGYLMAQDRKGILWTIITTGRMTQGGNQWKDFDEKIFT